MLANCRAIRCVLAVQQQTAIVPMRSASRAWPSRLFAAAVALALAVACVIGAYAHAAGHQPPHAGHAEALSDIGGHDGYASSSVSVAPDHGHARGHAGCGHDADHPGHSLDCCDTICYGGQAILAAAPVVSAALLCPTVHRAGCRAPRRRSRRPRPTAETVPFCLIAPDRFGAQAPPWSSALAGTEGLHVWICSPPPGARRSCRGNSLVLRLRSSCSCSRGPRSGARRPRSRRGAAGNGAGGRLAARCRHLGKVPARRHRRG